jgi:predicted transcriptional regulator
MAASTTRIAARDRERLHRLAQDTGQSHQEVIGKALEVYERECFLDAINAGFAELRADPQAWDDELAERAFWDATSNDFGRDS